MIKTLWNNLSVDVQKALGNANWLLFGRILSMVMGLVTTIVLARKLGVDDFGQMSFILAWAGFMMPFTAMGLQGILTKQFHDEPKETQKILGTGLLIRTIGSILGALVLIGIYTLASSDSNIWLFILLVFAQSFAAAKAATSWFESRVDIAPITIVTLWVTLIASVVKIIFALNGYNWQTILLVFVIELVVNGLIPILLFYFHFGLFPLSIDIKRLKGMLKNGLWLFFGGIASAIYLKIDMVMLGEMTSQSEVGIYAAATKLSVVWYFLPAALVASFFPWLLKAKKENNDLYTEKLQKISDIIFVGSIIIALLITILSPFLINILYGSSYSAASSILIIHIWSLIFVFFRALVSKWLIMENLVAYSLLSHSLGAIVNIAINLLLIPKYAGYGAAIGTLIAFIFSSLIFLFFSRETRSMGILLLKSFWCYKRIGLDALNYIRK